MEIPLTRQLAAFCHNLRYDTLPVEVIDRAKYFFLDYLGVAVRGSLSDSSQPLYRVTASLSAPALGIAGSQAAGSMEFLTDGAWTKRLHPGWAAFSGIHAALLAREGFVGPATIVEGKDGFLKAYSLHPDPGRVTDGLGTSFQILQTAVKPHACCRYIGRKVSYFGWSRVGTGQGGEGAERRAAAGTRAQLAQFCSHFVGA